MSHYHVLTLSSVRPDQIDLLTGVLFDHGASGVQEDLDFEQIGEFYEVKEIPKELTKLLVYFEEPPSDELKTHIKEHYPEIEMSMSSEENRDWLEEWKKGYKSFELVNGIYVVPSWLETPAEAKAAIKIDPGMAFGTGTHETTQLASKLLVKIDNPESKSVMDVGTGTGILAFLAEHLGFQKLVGLEIDDEARRTARENVGLNNSKLVIDDSLAEKYDGEFDVVIANIIDGVLSRLQDHLKRMTLPGGHLLLTGILDEREERFRQSFSFDGFDIVERTELGEWVGYLLRKKS